MPLIRKPAPSAPIESSANQPGRLLSEGDENARWAAARAASGLPDHLDRLADALTHEQSPRVREALFTSLCAVSDSRAVELILPFVRSDDAHLRTCALDALHVMASVVEPYLPRLLADDDPDVRLLACELVRDVPTDRASVLLSALLDREPLPNVCASAIEVLAQTGDLRAFPALDRCAARFPGEAFLQFAIRVTANRLQSQAAAVTRVEVPPEARPGD